MKLLGIKIKNFLSISDVELAPGKITQIVGANNQGKTSILRAIEVALKGSSDGSLVKKGEEAAEVVLDFDEMNVRRRLKTDGSQTVQVKKGEFKASSPQSVLDGLVHVSAFNPLELLDPKRRTENLLKAIPFKTSERDIVEAAGNLPIPLPPLDYESHGLTVAEQVHRYFFQRRAEANKAAKEKADRYRVEAEKLVGLPAEDPAAESDADLASAIESERKKIASESGKSAVAQERENRLAQIRGNLSRLSDENSKLAQVVESFPERRGEGRRALQARHEAELVTTKERHQLEAKGQDDNYDRARKDLEEKSNQLAADLDNEKKAEGDALNALNDSKPDQSIIENANLAIQQLQEKQTRNAKLAAARSERERIRVIEEQATSADGFAKKLDENVEALGAKFRASLIAKAELPVAGLAYEHGAFTLDGSSIDNLSASRALRLSLSIARKLAGETKIICIDGAELLDQETFLALEAEIQTDGFVYILTKVGEPFRGVDGEIRSKVVEMEGGVAK